MTTLGLFAGGTGCVTSQGPSRCCSGEPPHDEPEAPIEPDHAATPVGPTPAQLLRLLATLKSSTNLADVCMLPSFGAADAADIELVLEVLA